jgi:hypothetical protein
MDGPNARRHWAERASRARFWRELAANTLRAAEWPTPLPDNGKGWVVEFWTFQKRGKPMDSDNAAACAKALRDGIAAYLAVDDAPGGIEWRYLPSIKAEREMRDGLMLVLKTAPEAPRRPTGPLAGQRRVGNRGG